MGILLSLIPLLTWGAGDYIASRYTKGVHPFSASAFYSITGFCFSMAVVSFFPHPIFYLDRTIYALLASICLNIGFLSMLKGFTRGPVGIVATIANAYAIVTAAIGFFILGIDVSFSKFAGISVVILGIGMISYTKPKNEQKYNRFSTIAYSTLALLFFGIGFSFFDKASVQQWPQNMAVYQIANVIVACSIWIVFQKNSRLHDLKYMFRQRLAYFAGIAGSTGQMAMFAALKYADVAVVSAVAAAAPMVTALLAYIFDREHLTLVQRFATVVVVAGIVLLSISK